MQQSQLYTEYIQSMSLWIEIQISYNQVVIKNFGYSTQQE
jgi:hypothetical protein